MPAECPVCHTPNPSGRLACVKCSTPFELDQEPVTLGDVTLPPGDETLAPGDETVVIDPDGPPDSGSGSSWTSPGKGTAQAKAPMGPGSVLAGRYEILAVLGEGGMGLVYKAHDLELDRVVALKVVRPEFANSAEVMRRFKQELILARQVTHKNVIRIFDLGVADGLKFITMDFFEGRDLMSVLVEHGKMPVDETVKIIRQVLLGLQAAHNEGVVHRDLKPHNIMVDNQGHVCLMDFGIARSLELASMTRTGTMMGSPDYMSPEQARGEKVDIRSDLFSVGVILYEMLTDVQPYAAPGVMATLLKRTQEKAKPPIELVPSLPRYLNDIVVRCLEISRELRYQTSGEIIADLDAARATPATPSASALAQVSVAPEVRGALAPGTHFGPRYRIEALLGEGGMGKVYKAYDLELARTVAIKMVRPELVADPSSMDRLKQELLLASRVSQKNILRIHDLGDVDGTKFISMAYVDGEDLHHLIQREGRLSIDRAVGIARQLCRALEAAHAEGVVHRDFKPQNVLMDGAGNAYVSDFGLAKSLEAGAAMMTRAGEVLGTPRYMSPEQAESKSVDHRTDLYALGLVLYEMVTGDLPFRSDTVLQAMYERVTLPPKNPKLLNPDLPDSVVNVIMRCLEKDTGQRYQSAAEILADLESGAAAPPPLRVDASGAQQPVPAPSVQTSFLRTARGRAAIAAGALAVILGAGFYFRGRLTGRAATPPPPMTFVVSDFVNTTGEPVFNGTVEPALTTALEGATFLTAYNRGEARRLGQQLQPGATALDETLAKLVAVRQGLPVVISGSIAKDAGGYQLTVRAVDPFTSKVITTSQLDGISRDGVLASAAKLAAGVRKALRDDTPESLQLAAAESFSAGSLEAAHEYAMGEQAEWSGKTQDAITAYSRAVELDPNLGRAYANIAAMYANQGKREDAEKFHQLAMTRVDRMSDREKYKTRGLYFLLTRNDLKAVEELTNLVKLYPSDGGGLQNLSYAYFDLRAFPKALEMGRRASALQPKNVSRRNNVAFYALYASDFETAIREARGALELNPKYAKAYLVIALAQVAQGKPAEAAQTYQTLGGVNSLGASLASIGLADLALYEGRVEDASPILKKGIAQDEEAKNNAAASIKWAALAQVELLSGRKPQMQAAAEKALAISDSDHVRVTVAQTYVRAGLAPKAMGIASKLAAKASVDSQAYAKLIEGQVHLARGNARDAIKSFQDAQKLADTWLGRYDLARANFEAGMLIEANSELDADQERLGEATAAFLDDIPTTRYLPEIYYYQGRVHEGLKSPGSTEAYRTYLTIKQGTADDPLVKDARRRVANR